ncbi:uncharacterized protein MONOS_12607 [Monocercomonoides exilis]|uniref:uncharacterized protein n=1 Tax=Monocercomonoides exilis TaxID=2049356 RepID=UPI0035596E5D|nr:hypothetical protein MONOS_12607 [Monocercomonoides exilis]|eukprot:MONOS_12607.1-p1 / transcript=MONOS_12607.1 / gene=MONOS_12607 / organism=Monocercomonoides_exilis_PA203 / gene_product=unspecified product / transcript_product=unspecified product / location=Mono_scaffold00708:19806-20039(+) / protein_length=78 / sequence_SO=supercontig / SO=protein_coding / is_pseudo=false
MLLLSIQLLFNINGMTFSDALSDSMIRMEGNKTNTFKRQMLPEALADKHDECECIRKRLKVVVDGIDEKLQEETVFE